MLRSVLEILTYSHIRIPRFLRSGDHRQASVPKSLENDFPLLPVQSERPVRRCSHWFPQALFPFIIRGFVSSNADVAQVVEQRIRNAWVGGSNPSVGTNKNKGLRHSA